MTIGKTSRPLETFPNLEEDRVITRNGLLKRASFKRDKFGFKNMRFENLKDGWMDTLSLRNVQLGANYTCQDWVYKFESNLRKEITEATKVDKSMQSKRRQPN